MWSLARKILMHDRVKFLIAEAGVSVSVMLILVQVGLYFGFMQNASIDHSAPICGSQQRATRTSSSPRRWTSGPTIASWRPRASRGPSG